MEIFFQLPLNMAIRLINNLAEKIGAALGKTEFQPVSRYQKAKRSWRVQRTVRDYLRSGLFVGLGVLSAGFGLKGFLMPNNFIDGGVMGISLLMNKWSRKDFGRGQSYIARVPGIVILQVQKYPVLNFPLIVSQYPYLFKKLFYTRIRVFLQFSKCTTGITPAIQ